MFLVCGKWLRIWKSNNVNNNDMYKFFKDASFIQILFLFGHLYFIGV